MGLEHQRAIHDYVGGSYLPDHTDYGPEPIGGVKRQFEGAELDFIRSAAWALLTAWTQR